MRKLISALKALGYVQKSNTVHQVDYLPSDIAKEDAAWWNDQVEASVPCLCCGKGRKTAVLGPICINCIEDERQAIHNR